MSDVIENKVKVSSDLDEIKSHKDLIVAFVNERIRFLCGCHADPAKECMELRSWLENYVNENNLSITEEFDWRLWISEDCERM